MTEDECDHCGCYAFNDGYPCCYCNEISSDEDF